jgi:hypothetical protein
MRGEHAISTATIMIGSTLLVIMDLGKTMKETYGSQPIHLAELSRV